MVMNIPGLPHGMAWCFDDSQAKGGEGRIIAYLVPHRSENSFEVVLWGKSRLVGSTNRRNSIEEMTAAAIAIRHDHIGLRQSGSFPVKLRKYPFGFITALIINVKYEP